MRLGKVRESKKTYGFNFEYAKDEPKLEGEWQSNWQGFSLKWEQVEG
jgi:hypothetical protein